MTNTPIIDVKVTRALCIKGVPHPAGKVLALVALEAGHLLMSGRCELLDPSQRPWIDAALKDEATRCVGRENSRVVGAFGPGPWQ